MIENHWDERHELQRQGIEVAKSDGKYLGRPRIEFPENWEECYKRWREGTITAREAMKLMNLKKDSFYRLVKKYESGEWDADVALGVKGKNIFYVLDMNRNFETFMFFRTAEQLELIILGTLAENIDCILDAGLEEVYMEFSKDDVDEKCILRGR